MFYLFTQTFFWLLAAFIAGFVMAWWLRGRVDEEEQFDEQLMDELELESASTDDEQPEVPDEWKPEGLLASAAEGKDDLKIIKSLGPKREERLNNLGIYKYSQLAALDTNNIAWVRANIKASRRLPIEEWVAEAKELADQQADNT